MARAIGNVLVWVARAWRGRGAGMTWCRWEELRPQFQNNNFGTVARRRRRNRRPTVWPKFTSTRAELGVFFTRIRMYLVSPPSALFCRLLSSPAAPYCVQGTPNETPGHDHALFLVALHFYSTSRRSAVSPALASQSLWRTGEIGV
eukprot:gene25350-biopygen11991